MARCAKKLPSNATSVRATITRPVSRPAQQAPPFASSQQTSLVQPKKFYVVAQNNKGEYYGNCHKITTITATPHAAYLESAHPQGLLALACDLHCPVCRHLRLVSHRHQNTAIRSDCLRPTAPLWRHRFRHGAGSGRLHTAPALCAQPAGHGARLALDAYLAGHNHCT